MRVYGKVVNVFVTGKGWMKRNELDKLLTKKEKDMIEMYEVEYTDYREDGTICGKGTEDISSERLRAMNIKTGYYVVKKDSGERTKTGRIRWDDFGERLILRVAAKDYSKALKMFKALIEVDGKKVFNV